MSYIGWKLKGKKIIEHRSESGNGNGSQKCCHYMNYYHLALFPNKRQLKLKGK